MSSAGRNSERGAVSGGRAAEELGGDSKGEGSAGPHQFFNGHWFYRKTKARPFCILMNKTTSSFYFWRRAAITRGGLFQSSKAGGGGTG